MKKVRIYSAFCQSNQNDWRFYLVQVRANNKKEALEKLQSYCREGGIIEKNTIRRTR